ncbi:MULTISPECIES: hypothetical protein [Rhizobium]|uniref:hypothetical protein n=1 Tax=Rhizobium TaxID=379 RepID=UPI000FF1480C|nr:MULTISPECIES: hypothetical protein [Rhizobium]RKE85031.1 hypothetical protein DFO46_1815 [Rhizobium sp. AG855]
MRSKISARRLWRVCLRPALLGAAFVGSLAVLEPPPLHAGPLLDAAAEAERKAAAGDSSGAFEAIHAGMARFTASLPLSVPRALFVTETPTAYRAYTAKKEPIFEAGESLLAYVEVLGLQWQPVEGDRHQAHFTVDLELSDDKGKTLALQKEFGNFTFTAHSPAQEVYTHLTLDVSGAAPGAYILRYTINDVAAERSVPFELPFTLVEKKS